MLFGLKILFMSSSFSLLRFFYAFFILFRPYSFVDGIPELLWAPRLLSIYIFFFSFIHSHIQLFSFDFIFHFILSFNSFLNSTGSLSSFLPYSFASFCSFNGFRFKSYSHYTVVMRYLLNQNVFVRKFYVFIIQF